MNLVCPAKPYILSTLDPVLDPTAEQAGYDYVEHRCTRPSCITEHYGSLLITTASAVQ